MDGGNGSGNSRANTSTGDSTTAAQLKGESNARKGDSKAHVSDVRSGFVDDSGVGGGGGSVGGGGGSSGDDNGNDDESVSDPEMDKLSVEASVAAWWRREEKIALYREKVELAEKYDKWYCSYAGPLREMLFDCADIVDKLNVFVVNLATRTALRWKDDECSDDQWCRFDPRHLASKAALAVDTDENDTQLAKATLLTASEKAAYHHVLENYRTDPDCLSFALNENYLTTEEPAPLIAAAASVAREMHAKEKKRLKNAADKARAKERVRTEAAAQAAAKPLAQLAQCTQSSSSKSETTVSCAKATNVGPISKNTMGSLTSTTLDKCSAPAAPPASTAKGTTLHPKGSV